MSIFKGAAHRFGDVEELGGGSLNFQARFAVTPLGKHFRQDPARTVHNLECLTVTITITIIVAPNPSSPSFLSPRTTSSLAEIHTYSSSTSCSRCHSPLSNPQFHASSLSCRGVLNLVNRVCATSDGRCDERQAG